MMKASMFTLFVLLSVASAFVGCADGSSKAKDAGVQASGPGSVGATAAQPDAAAGQVVVYYFHSTRRCPTCLGIQATIEKTIQARFAAEVASSVLTFQAVNIDQEQNKHFVKEYDISFSSMVVTAKKGQATVKWENCNEVWDLAHQEPALADYAEKQIRAYLDLLKSG
jgi:hypothetical protein